MAVRTELYCTFCGHGAGEVFLPVRGRPTNAQLKAAYLAQHPASGPAWAGDQPRCRRCGGQLFLDELQPSRLRTAS